DPDGEILWAKSFGGPNEDAGSGISSDSHSNILVTGFYSDSQIQMDAISLLSAGYEDIYLVKLDPGGNVIWAKNAGGEGFDHVQSLAIDYNDNIVVTGYFGSLSMTFDSIVVVNSSFVYDVFLVKYDETGKALWATTAAGSSLDGAYSVTIDKFANIFIAGAFYSNTINFGATTLTNSGGYDLFLAKYDPSGDNVWAIGGGGKNYDEIFCVSVDQDENLFIAGGFWSDTMYMGSDTIINSDRDSIESQDLFFAKISNIKTGTDFYPEDPVLSFWKVFPNPGQDQFNILSNDRIDEVLISDLTGKIIIQAKPATNTYSFEIEQTGMYFIILSSNGIKSTQKLIVIQ
ncbi:MAG: T9SS type A sorting domain-containing protein, partial [Saprospiraceae bacterium]